MQRISLGEIKNAAKPLPPGPDTTGAIRKLKAAVAKLKAHTATVSNSARQHPDV